MMYPFMTLNNNTEIVHSELYPDGRIKVHIETPDEEYGFRYATCWLPFYKWETIYKYSKNEMNYFQSLICTYELSIIRASQKGNMPGISMSSNYVKE